MATVPETTAATQPKGRLDRCVSPVVIHSPPVEEPKKTGQATLIKTRLIAWIVVDYLIDLFNRNSRDYRQVSKELALMKSDDKIHQQEERIRAQVSAGTVRPSFTSSQQGTDVFLRLFSRLLWRVSTRYSAAAVHTSE